MCLGHVTWEMVDEVIDEMFGLDDRMIYLVLVEARRIRREADEKPGWVAREYKRVRAAEAARNAAL